MMKIFALLLVCLFSNAAFAGDAPTVQTAKRSSAGIDPRFGNLDWQRNESLKDSSDSIFTELYSAKVETFGAVVPRTGQFCKLTLSQWYDEASTNQADAKGNMKSRVAIECSKNDRITFHTNVEKKGQLWPTSERYLSSLSSN